MFWALTVLHAKQNKSSSAFLTDISNIDIGKGGGKTYENNQK